MKSLILIGGAFARYEEFVIERDPIENVLPQCHLYSNPNRCTWDQPVCGQDAFNSPFTFKNPCLLLFEYCTGNRTLKFLNFGKCMQNDFVENSDSNVEEAEEIEPECPMCLSRIYNPVCLRSGVEVDRCEFDRGLCTGRFESESEIAHEGNCDKKCPRFCNRMRIETCGSDGMIYSNPCMLKDANCRSADKYIFAENDFKPCCAQACPRIREPVCGDNGKTYNNRCELEVENCINRSDVRIANEGKCSCNRACPMIYAPICSENDLDFDNECALEIYNCENDTNFGIKSEGSCEETFVNPVFPGFPGFENDFVEPEESFESNLFSFELQSDMSGMHCWEAPALTTREFMPVCASDGTTQSNPSVFKNYVCEKRKSEEIEIGFEHYGRCDNFATFDIESNLLDLFCPVEDGKYVERPVSRDYRPVCASDGTTHANHGTFKNYVCRMRIEENSQISFSNHGSCMLMDSIKKEEPEEESENSWEDPKCEKYMRAKCPTSAAADYCGSDGNVYNSLCHFRKGRCENPDLSLAMSSKKCDRKTKKNFNKKKNNNVYRPFKNMDFMGRVGRK